MRWCSNYTMLPQTGKAYHDMPDIPEALPQALAQVGISLLMRNVEGSTQQRTDT
jgi:hypothetical protein